MAKMKVEFEGFDELINRLSKLGADTKEIAEEGMIEARQHVNKKLESAMEKHNRTHRTVQSIDTRLKPSWSGEVGKLPVGFNIGDGGMASIFLMYGTPRMKKDTKLYSAIWGKATINEIVNIQEEILYKEIRRLT